MNLYELIENRTSIRKYKSDMVPMETVLKVVKAARMAPSSYNYQCWRFLIIEDQAKRESISKLVPNCANAPYIIILCANPKESTVRGGMEYYIFDSALAMENLVLAAQEEGLATCILGGFDESPIRSLLNIPADFKILAMTPLGYGDEDLRTRERKDESEVVYLNSWGENTSG